MTAHCQSCTPCIQIKQPSQGNMSVASLGLPSGISCPFMQAGDAGAKSGASSYLRFDAGDQQSFTLLASGDSTSPDKNNLVLLSKAQRAPGRPAGSCQGG